MMLGSDAREDKCRQCGGDGSSCNTISGTLDMKDLQVGTFYQKHIFLFISTKQLQELMSCKKFFLLQKLVFINLILLLFLSKQATMMYY